MAQETANLLSAESCSDSESPFILDQQVSIRRDGDGCCHNGITCCHCGVASHPYIAVAIAFLAFMVDAALVSVVDPILPDMLRQMELTPDRLTVKSFFAKPHPLPANGTENLQTQHSVQIAVIVGMKPLLETFFNIAAGFLIDSTGYRLPMLLGCGLNLVATLCFAYLRNFSLLVMTRVLQALGSSLSVVGAMAYLASSFKDDTARLKAASIAFSGFSVGIAGGYTMGSFLYQFCSTECPFLVIAGLNLIDACLRMTMLSSNTRTYPSKTSGLQNARSLLTDPLIVVTLLINFMQKFCMGVYLGTGPAWLLYTLHAQQWNIGVIMGCSAVMMVTAQFIAGRFSKIHNIWLPVFIALLLITAGVSLYPVCTSTWQVLAPELTGCIGHGILMACLNPMLCHIVDMRHNSQYGLINGLYTSSYNFALGVGPYVGGGLLKVISFNWLFWGLGIVMVFFSFSALSWRNIPKHHKTLTEEEPGSS